VLEKQLNEVVWFQEGPGVRNTQYTTSGVKLLNVANLSDGKIVLANSTRYISKDEAYGKYKHFLCDAGDLIIASSGIKVDYIDKKMGIVTEDMLPLCMNTSTIRFKVKNTNELKLKYLMYFFKSDKYKEQIQKLITGSAQLNYGPSHLNKVKITMYPLKEQEKIVKELDQLTSILSKKQEKIEKYNLLIKSQFNEMFGDPKINPNKYEIVKIEKLFDVGSSKRVFESQWTNSGVPFYRAREIVKLSKDGFVNNELFITSEMYEEYKSIFGVPQANDIMVTGVGTLGICYIVKDSDKFYFKDGNILWFKNKGLCDARFIFEQYKLDYVREQIESNANPSTVGTYTIANAKNTLVLVPPLELQQKYGNFCKHIDKLKFAIKKSIEKYELCYQSLMQKYFG